MIELLDIGVGADVAFMCWNVNVTQRNRLGSITMLLDLALWISQGGLVVWFASVDGLRGRGVQSRTPQWAVELEGARVREALVVGARCGFRNVFG